MNNHEILSLEKFLTVGRNNLFISVKSNSDIFNNNNNYYLLSLNDLSNFIASFGQASVYVDLSANGTTIETTSILNYGINIFSTVSYTNYATRLPIPVTGQSVTVVNNSGFYMMVFPYAVGGSINSVTNNGVIIPPDGKSYVFNCIENPLPGAWTWTPPAVGQIVFPEITVSHTKGSDTWTASIDGTNFEASYGGGVGNGIILLPSNLIWDTLPFQAMVTKIKVYTNILPIDIVDDYITLDRISVYLDASNSVAIQMPYMGWFTGSDPDLYNPIYDGFVTGATTLSSPPNVGDTGTLYRLDNQPIAISSNIGVGQFSNHYFGLGFNIKSDALTKDYKFKVFFEYL